MNCRVCGHEIGKERLEALPGTTVCVAHSTSTRPIGFMDFGHKTAPTMVVIRADQKEDLRRATRAFRRSR